VPGNRIITTASLRAWGMTFPSYLTWEAAHSVSLRMAGTLSEEPAGGMLNKSGITVGIKQTSSG
jgi:hypothetical protein